MKKVILAILIVALIIIGYMYFKSQKELADVKIKEISEFGLYVGKVYRENGFNNQESLKIELIYQPTESEVQKTLIKYNIPMIDKTSKTQYFFIPESIMKRVGIYTIKVYDGDELIYSYKLTRK